MFCALIRWWLDDYVDGVLKGRRLQWVRSHLDSCASCAKELRWRRSLRSALQATVSAPSSQEMWLEFQQRLAQRRQPVRTRHVAWWQWAPAVATVACALVLGVVYVNRQPTETPAATTSEPAERSAGAVAMSSADPETVRPPEQHVVSAPAGSASAVRKPSQPIRRDVPPRPRMAMVRPSEAPAVRPEPQPVVLASIAYAEVRNASGELVGKVLLQTTYDEKGQPQAVQIEFNSSAVVEVDSDEQPADTLDDYSGSSGTSADSPVPAEGARMGVSD